MPQSADYKLFATAGLGIDGNTLPGVGTGSPNRSEQLLRMTSRPQTEGRSEGGR